MPFSLRSPSLKVFGARCELACCSKQVSKLLRKADTTYFKAGQRAFMGVYQPLVDEVSGSTFPCDYFWLLIVVMSRVRERRLSIARRGNAGEREAAKQMEQFEEDES